MAGVNLLVGIALAVGVLAILLGSLYVLARRRGAQAGLHRIVRCDAGHLFALTVVPGVSVGAVRLGSVRYQYCTVGKHWAFVKAVDPATLSPEQRTAAEATPDTRIP